MKKVLFELVTGKVVRIKEKLAAHLEKVGKGEIVQEREVDAAPAAADMAEANGIDLSSVEGSGKDGRILKRDVQGYMTRMMKAD